MKSVYRCDLSKQDFFDVLPDEIFQNKKLRYLNLSENSLIDFPYDAEELYNLIELIAHTNRIDFIPPSFCCSVKKLKHLNLYANEIKEIPKEIGLLVSLEKLDLACNQIKTIPPEIGSLIQLKRLDFSLNEIENIPIEIKHLKRLKRLDISCNNLFYIPHEIEDLVNCKMFDFRDNGLLYVDYGISTRKLRLDGNLFFTKEEWIEENEKIKFKKFPTLVELSTSKVDSHFNNSNWKDRKDFIEQVIYIEELKEKFNHLRYCHNCHTGYLKSKPFLFRDQRDITKLVLLCLFCYKKALNGRIIFLGYH